MNICFAASECVPFVKTGGLADVSGALPRSLAAAGDDVRVFLPLYGSIDPETYGLKRTTDLTGLEVYPNGRTETFSILEGTLPDSGIPVYLVECPQYFARENIYTDDPDEHRRFILFQLAVLRTMERLDWRPDIVHANDWQTALLPVYLKQGEYSLFRKTRSVLSIHNIGYQGMFAPEAVSDAGLDPALSTPGGPFEYWGGFSFLKAGLCYADAVSTVSPSYATEIQTEEYGAGLEGVLTSRKDRIAGILNGVDTDTWNPSTDPLITRSYAADSLEFKAPNRTALLARFDLPDPGDIPVVGIVSRFASQKGFDLLFPLLDEGLRRREFLLTVLGSGDPETEDFFRKMAAAHPEALGVHVGYDEQLAHLIEAGADIFLMPSIYEPCGLNQMYSLRYGTVPVVRKTGGLADTVIDLTDHPRKGTGFVFTDATPDALKGALNRAVDAYADPVSWKKIQKRGMSVDFSWDAAAASYKKLYNSVVQRPAFQLPE